MKELLKELFKNQCELLIYELASGKAGVEVRSIHSKYRYYYEIDLKRLNNNEEFKMIVHQSILKLNDYRKEHNI